MINTVTMSALLAELRTLREAQRKERAVVVAAVAWFNKPGADDDAVGNLAADLGLVNALDEGGFIPPPDPLPALPDAPKGEL